MLMDKNLKSIHNRMPLILDDSSIDTYLNEKIPFDDSYAVSSSHFKYHKVSTMVNSTVNNNDRCIHSIE